MRPTLLPLAALLPAVLAGCMDTDCGALAQEDASVEIGWGEDEFHPLADGDVVDLYAGSQGGHHVWGAARTAGIARGHPFYPYDEHNPLVSFSLVAADGTVVAETYPDRFLFREDEDGRGWMSGARVIVYGPSGTEEGAPPLPYTFSVRVEDTCGRVVEDERVVDLP
ncbi:hypothetical protein L6R50_14415 [Myxococcota bacterium]|nr:hypothetical protein [Myxococcota bacterium]